MPTFTFNFPTDYGRPNSIVHVRYWLRLKLDDMDGIVRKLEARLVEYFEQQELGSMKTKECKRLLAEEMSAFQWDLEDWVADILKENVELLYDLVIAVRKATRSKKIYQRRTANDEDGVVAERIADV